MIFSSPLEAKRAVEAKDFELMLDGRYDFKLIKIVLNYSLVNKF